MNSQNYFSASHIIIGEQQFAISSATASQVEVEGVQFKVEIMFSLLVGTRAKITPAPIEGWDGAESGYGREFFYKIAVSNGDTFFRKYADEPLCCVGDSWKEGDTLMSELYIKVDPETSRVIYCTVD
jgi:hypothetical protein